MDDSSVWNNLVALHTDPTAWAEEGEQLFSSSKAFANSQNVKKQRSRLKKQIGLLQTQEKRVYGRFFTGCTKYSDFIKRLRELFDTKHNIDMQIIQNFAAEKIQVLLDKNFGTQMLPSKNLITEILTLAGVNLAGHFNSFSIIFFQAVNIVGFKHPLNSSIS